MLEGAGQSATAQRILTAVGSVLTERSVLTPDLGGQGRTSEMTDAIIRAMG
jgi:tartrate dehydrogenase/decarboxylase/D-malate dehydrogenase